MNAAKIGTFFKDNKLATACISLSMVAVVYYFTNSSTVADLELDLQNLESKERVMAFNVKHGAQLQEDIEEAKKLSQAIMAKTVQPEQEALTIRYFYKLEENSGIRLEYPRLKEKGEFELGSFVPFVYSMEISGTFGDCMKFLDTIESSNLWGEITKIKISADSRPPSLDSEPTEGLPQNLSRMELSFLLLASK